MGSHGRQPLPFDPVEQAQRQWEKHGWSDVALGMAAITSIMRAQQILLARVTHELRDFDLTFARYEMLMLLQLSAHGSLPLGTLGARLQVHPTSVTGTLDGLERSALVVRAPQESDRRTKLAVITDEGRRRVMAATLHLNATVLARPGMTDEQCRQVIESLRALRLDTGDFELTSRSSTEGEDAHGG